MMSLPSVWLAFNSSRTLWQRPSWAAIAATWLMIVTGWRRGEVLGLRWSEIDLLRRTARLADTKTGASLRPVSEVAGMVIQSQPRIGDVVFASRSGQPIVGYAKMWLRIAKLRHLPADITPACAAPFVCKSCLRPRLLRAVLGHKTHCITSRYVHSADAVLLAAADAVGNATMKLMAEKSDLAPDQAAR